MTQDKMVERVLITQSMGITHGNAVVQGNILRQDFLYTVAPIAGVGNLHAFAQVVVIYKEGNCHQREQCKANDSSGPLLFSPFRFTLPGVVTALQQGAALHLAVGAPQPNIAEDNEKQPQWDRQKIP